MPVGANKALTAGSDPMDPDASIANGDEAIARQLFSELPRQRRATILRELDRAKRIYPFTTK